MMTPLTDQQIKHMVDRFLSWKLPSDFRPDGGVSYRGAGPGVAQEATPYGPSGTNLFDAGQAEAMIRHMVDGL